MNRPDDSDRLLTEVVAEAAPADFRDAVLGQTLRLARRRRWSRRAQRAAATLALLGVLAVLIWQSLPQRPAVSQPPITSYKIIHSRPLPPEAIVVTWLFPAERVVASFAFASVVTTREEAPGYREINDDELLAMVAPRPAVLVRHGPREAELVFVNPEDRNGFPLN